jgi:hypothetical protein
MLLSNWLTSKSAGGALQRNHGWLRHPQQVCPCSGGQVLTVEDHAVRNARMPNHIPR